VVGADSTGSSPAHDERLLSYMIAVAGRRLGAFCVRSSRKVLCQATWAWIIKSPGLRLRSEPENSASACEAVRQAEADITS